MGGRMRGVGARVAYADETDELDVVRRQMRQLQCELEREKLLTRGPTALTDTELLALLLRTGTAGRGVLQMAQEVLETDGPGAEVNVNADAVGLKIREIVATLLITEGA